MDILLVYPPFSVQERYGDRGIGKVGGHLPPLGISSIAAFLREKGFSVGILDAVALELTPEDVAGYVKEHKPAIVGFSGLTTMFHRAVLSAAKVREAAPDTLIIVGGQHATLMPREELSRNECFDLLAFGEGELTALELIEKYRDSGWNRAKFLADTETLASILGIAFRKNGEIALNSARPLIEDLDSLPLPARDLLPMDKYIPLPNQYKRVPVANMVCIRGCPFECSFCSASGVFGKRVRSRSPAKVVEEIAHLVHEYGIREISFWDDEMTINQKWAEEVCDRLIEAKLDVTWTCYCRVDMVTADLLKKMKAAGCWNIFYGIESGDQTLLNNIMKHTTLEKIRNAVKWTRDAGIEVRGSFMLALPGETPELARKTIEFAIELDPDYAQFSVTTPYPGTRLYSEAEKYGTLTKNFTEYHGWNAVFVPFGYKNREEVVAMQKEAFRKFYMRPAYVFGRLKKINSLEDVKRYLKGLRFVLGFTS